jgi:putative nucleotidyltransferase with HDIG domain/PAS domain S-box-containing protein
MKLTDFIIPEDQKTFRDTFAEFKKKGFADNIELSLRRKDGAALPVLISATAQYDKNGNFLRSRSIVRDISARMGYRYMLENSIEEWRVTFDSMPYGVLLLDLEFTIKRTNKYFMILYDLPGNTVNEQKCYEVIRSDRLMEIFNSLRLNRPVNLNAFEYFEKSTNKYFLINLTPTPDRQGITTGFVLVLIDISELKEKENRLSESRDAFFNMLKELDFSYRELKGLHEGLIHSFVNAIDAKSPWTKGHSERVTAYALSISREMALKEEEVENLRVAALLHDIGKIGTYDVILDNPKTLSPEEFALINMHPVRGVEIIRPIKQLEAILPIIRHHHEKIDGTGYPDGLKGEEIPFLARILCIADAYDSMTSDRPYRPARSRDYAMSELIRCSNTQFDPHAVEAFLRVLNTFNDK